ncbi:carbohydrate esterase family 16 protein [Trichoderma asperellum CBS 433.97]|uniref:Carbohydrate esterase family 16 protein n=1 Tax=Trichoderma asperellum (strain ATCC 204424 / CBS 433.97 / NBRC 101777) TaxID=1042311 RepID=A0A2T3ZD19_TRIA4|nr:carbohydrate esterase family 16 protein [Trichoderma asperellum CBS 433.97]PTB42707.1 carbohydrate esterase family 16 protein [Trichoderma asperellum CBS 433.97]
MPAWIADSHSFIAASAGEKFYTGSTDNTLYEMWIGVNDIGKKNIFIDIQEPGTSLTTYTDCVFVAFDSIYRNGGRKIILLNVPPLELHTLYATPQSKVLLPGSANCPDKPSNLTEVSFKMYEYSRTVNEIFKFQVPFQQHIAKDTPVRYGQSMEIHQNPQKYLNGTSTLDILDFIHHCSSGEVDCTDLPGDRDSFMFYDSLHPSEQVHPIIAQNLWMLSTE